MNEKEALIRIKTGNFGNNYGFDIQLLVDAVGTIGEMFRSGQISEVVRCKDCKYGRPGACGYGVDCDGRWYDDNGFCSDGERK